VDTGRAKLLDVWQVVGIDLVALAPLPLPQATLYRVMRLILRQNIFLPHWGNH
jgi:hypothetical protein